MSRERECVTVTVEILHETENAIKVFDYYSEEEVWLPLSQINSIKREAHTDQADIEVARWIAEKKGMI